MQIDSILFKKQTLHFLREYDAIFIDFPSVIDQNKKLELIIFYHGKPIVAKNPPWDGGFIWTKDKYNNPWVAVACENVGASSWWPCKDHPTDEPDSLRIAVTHPSYLSAICNGQRESIVSVSKTLNKTTWFTSYPINNYNVTLNVGDYGEVSDLYLSPFTNDTLALDYYVLSYNVDTAQTHFEQVPTILECLEQQLGPYPFYRDGYALVETPYVGMEHQGAIAYGNKFTNGYQGKISAGLNFDFIIMHETGHEWWGNSITAADMAELWIHESFCTYSEALFVECKYGYNNMIEYLLTQKSKIQNEHPMIAPLGVHQQPKGTDIYYKGTWMLHTLRNIVKDDSLWLNTIRQLAMEKKYSIVTTNTIIDFFNNALGKDYTSFFNQYLHYTEIPILQYKAVKKGKNTELHYRWKTNVSNFDYPIEVLYGDGLPLILQPAVQWQKLKLNRVKPNNLMIDPRLYYVKSERK